MLTADLVRARRRGTELRLQNFDGATRTRALKLAEAYVGIAKRLVGKNRREYIDAIV